RSEKRQSLSRSGVPTRSRLFRRNLVECGLFIRVSLSRLNHWLPRIQAHPEIVQGTTEFHHQIADTLLPQADPVFHNAAAFDTAIDMLNAQPTLVERLVGPLLLPGQLLTAWLLRRHRDLHLREREGQEVQILQQPTPSREGVGAYKGRLFEK